MGGTQAETSAAGGRGTDSRENKPVLVAVWRGRSSPHVFAAVSSLYGRLQPQTSSRAPQPGSGRRENPGLSGDVCNLNLGEDFVGRNPELGLISGECRAKAQSAGAWMRPRAEAWWVRTDRRLSGDQPSLGDSWPTECLREPDEDTASPLQVHKPSDPRKAPSSLKSVGVQLPACRKALKSRFGKDRGGSQLWGPSTNKVC